MRIITFIEHLQLGRKILKHFDLWEVRPKPPPYANDPLTEASIIYDESSSPDPDD